MLHFGSTNPCRITRNVEQTKDVHMYIEEFILVDIWIHCVQVGTQYGTELNKHWKNAGLYTLATKERDM